MRLLLLLLLCGCASLNEQEKLESVEHEIVRKEYYLMWRRGCMKGHGVIYA